MRSEVIYEKGDHRWLFVGRDPKKPSKLFDTNQFLISSGDEALLTDPGGAEIFPIVMKNVSEHINLKKIKAIFCSHEDPDIISAIALWLSVCPNAKVYLSNVWLTFVAHYGIDFVENVFAISDKGADVKIGNITLDFLPAHFVHESGYFSLYDKEASIVFCGDVGGGYMPPNYPLYMENFEEYTKIITGFHQRIMPSNEAKNNWIRMVRRLSPNMLCPQHGSLFVGDKVKVFLDWFENLEVGIC